MTRVIRVVIRADPRSRGCFKISTNRLTTNWHECPRMNSNKFIGRGVHGAVVVPRVIRVVVCVDPRSCGCFKIYTNRFTADQHECSRMNSNN